MNNGLFAPTGVPQMSMPDTQRNEPFMMAPPPPVQQPPVSPQDEVDALNAQQQAATPVYVGDPTVDKYIHMFIGGGQ